MRKKGVGWIFYKLAGNKETKTESNTIDINNTAKIEVPQDCNTGSWFDCPIQVYPGSKEYVSQTSFSHISTNSSTIPTVSKPA